MMTLHMAKTGRDSDVGVAFEILHFEVAVLGKRRKQPNWAFAWNPPSGCESLKFPRVCRASSHFEMRHRVWNRAQSFPLSTLTPSPGGNTDTGSCKVEGPVSGLNDFNLSSRSNGYMFHDSNPPVSILLATIFPCRLRRRLIRVSEGRLERVQKHAVCSGVLATH